MSNEKTEKSRVNNTPEKWQKTTQKCKPQEKKTCITVKKQTKERQKKHGPEPSCSQTTRPQLRQLLIRLCLDAWQSHWCRPTARYPHTYTIITTTSISVAIFHTNQGQPDPLTYLLPLVLKESLCKSRAHSFYRPAVLPVTRQTLSKETGTHVHMYTNEN